MSTFCQRNDGDKHKTTKCFQEQFQVSSCDLSSLLADNKYMDQRRGAGEISKSPFQMGRDQICRLVMVNNYNWARKEEEKRVMKSSSQK